MIRIEVARASESRLRVVGLLGPHEYQAAIIRKCGVLREALLGSNENLASRLEQANKSFDTEIMVGEETVKQCGDEFEFRELDSIQVRGRKSQVKIFELVGYGQSNAPQKAG